MKTLLTAFLPWAEHTHNSSYDAVSALTDRYPDVQSCFFPVEWENAPKLLAEALQKNHYDLILACGMTPAKELCLESIAVNRCNVEKPDNLNKFPAYHYIRSTGRFSYEANIPTFRLVKLLREAGHPARESYHAGTYLCNMIFYTLMNYLEEESSSTLGGFLHIPKDAPVDHTWDQALELIIKNMEIQ